MFTFIAGIFTGAVGTILVMGLVSAGKPTESDIQVERKHADIWKREVGDRQHPPSRRTA